MHARRFARRRYLNQKKLIVHRSPNNESHFPFSSSLCLARLHSRELVWFDEDWCDLIGVLLSLLRWISRTLFFLLMKIAYCIRERSGGGCWRKRRSAVASTPHSRDFHLKQSPQSSLRRSYLLHINIKTTTPSRTCKSLNTCNHFTPPPEQTLERQHLRTPDKSSVTTNHGPCVFPNWARETKQNVRQVQGAQSNGRASAGVCGTRYTGSHLPSTITRWTV